MTIVDFTRVCPRKLYRLAWRLVRARGRWRAFLTGGGRHPGDRVFEAAHAAYELGTLAVTGSGFNGRDHYASCPMCGWAGIGDTGWKRESTFRNHVGTHCPVLGLLEQIRDTRGDDDPLVRRSRERHKRLTVVQAIERPSHVYVLRCASTGRIKIGMAVDVESRRLGLQYTPVDAPTNPRMPKGGTGESGRR